MTNTTTMIDIRTCTATELASSLLTHRTDSSSSSSLVQLLKDTIQILEQQHQGQDQQPTSTTLISPHSVSSSSPSPAGAVASVPSSATDLGSELLEEPFEASFVSPRLGKFSVQLYDGGLKATKTNDATVQVVLTSSTSSGNDAGDDDTPRVSHIIVFPKPEDCKTLVKSFGKDVHTTTGNLVVVRLDKPMCIQNKEVQQLCFALPSEKKIGPTGPKLTMDAARIISKSSGVAAGAATAGSGGTSSNTPTSAWCALLCHALTNKSTSASDGGARHQISVGHVQPGTSDGIFQSYQPANTSTTSGKMPFVTCYHGVNDGVLYPLQEGLLFFKPPRFIPRNELHSISCGRGGGGSGGGGSSSRYVDMHVTLSGTNDGEPTVVEFTNINREENPGLNAYIHNVLIPAMQQDAADATAAASKKKEKTCSAEETSTEDEAEDDDDVVVAEVESDDSDDEEDEEKEQAVRDDDDDDDDDDDEDFESEEGDDEDDDDMGGDDDDDDDDGYAKVVQDDFAKSLVKKKQLEKEAGHDDGSATESEDDNDEPRKSKRLRQG